MTSIELAPDDARALLAVCRRQVSWDPRMHARLVTTDRALGVYTAPPLDVLVFTAVPATVTGDDADRVTALTALAARAPTYNYDPGLLVMEIGGLLASAAMPREAA